MSTHEIHERNRIDYDQTMKYYLHLSEVRFKLLGLLPIVTAVAVGALSNVKDPSLQMAICFLGLMFTLGVTLYDLRNTQIYDRLQKPAVFLECEFGFPSHVEVTSKHAGGAVQDRPSRRMYIIWHDLGLAIVYAANLAVWIYLVLTNGPRSQLRDSSNSIVCLSLIAFIALTVTLVAFAWLNDREKCSHVCKGGNKCKGCNGPASKDRLTPLTS